MRDAKATGARVVVIGASPVLEPTARALEEAGHGVVLTADRRLAIDLALREQPALVVLFASTGDAEGRNVCRQIEAEGSLRSTFVAVALDHEPTSDDLTSWLEAGAEWCFPGPVNVDDLVGGIEMLIGLRRRGDELPSIQEQRYRSAFHHAASGLTLADLSGRFQDVNRAFCELLGYRREELIGIPFLDLTHPEDAAESRARFAEFLAGGGDSYRLCKRYIHRDGSVITGNLTVGAVRGDAGEMTGVISHVQDITDRKRTEELLHQQHYLMSFIIQHDPNAIAVYDRDLRYIYVSDRYLRDYKIEDVDVIGKHHYEVFPEMPQRWREVHARVLDGAIERSDADAFERPDGTLTHNRWECRPWRLPDGSIGGMITYTEVITKRVLAEMALAESEAKYRLLAEGSKDVIWTMDLEGRFTYVSPSVEEVAGFTPDEALAIPLDEYVTPESAALLASSLADELSKPAEERISSTRLEIQQFTKGGGIIDVEVTASWICDDDGNPIGLQGTARDIAERIEAEKERSRLEAQLRQSQKMEAVGRLAGGIAHDFNNLLTVINNYSDLVVMALGEDDPIRHDVEEIRGASARAAELTSQLLAFSRKQMIQPRAVDANEIVTRSEKMLRRLIREDIDLVFLPGENLGHVLLDPGQLDQVLFNLVANSRDAMPDGGSLTIETSGVRLDDAYVDEHSYARPGDHVLLTVSDTGKGMDEATRKSVFEPFFTTKEVGEGSGLGMSTVYGIVKQNRGTIEIYSELGHGTTVKIYLPVTEQEPDERSTGPTDEPPRGHETILLVEDEPAVRKTAERILDSLGYRVIATEGPADAISKLEQATDSVDMVLSDVVMPNMSGVECFEKLQAIRSDLRVLFMSGYTENTIARRGVLDPGTHFIQKPFTVDSLARKVRGVLDG